MRVEAIIHSLLGLGYKKCLTRITQMDRRILSLYAKDVTIREIVAIFKKMYDADESPMLIYVTVCIKEQVSWLGYHQNELLACGWEPVHKFV